MAKVTKTRSEIVRVSKRRATSDPNERGDARLASTVFSKPDERGLQPRRGEPKERFTSAWGDVLTAGRMNVADAIDAMDLVSRLLVALSREDEESRKEVLTEVQEHGPQAYRVLTMASMPALTFVEALVFGAAGRDLMKILSPRLRDDIGREAWEQLFRSCLATSDEHVKASDELPALVRGTLWRRVDHQQLRTFEDPWGQCREWFEVLGARDELRQFEKDVSWYEEAWQLMRDEPKGTDI